MKHYFEGWYFKHQFQGMSLAIIPGVAKEGERKWEAFVQVITKEKSYYVSYPIEEFKIKRNPLQIKVGENLFSTHGVQLHIKQDDLHLKARLIYGDLHPYKKPIMGPFSKLPRMECNHEILSMYHSVRGHLRYNEKSYFIQNGIGYMEKDWGKSFPCEYRWSQCLHQKKGKVTSIFTAIATIPYMGIKFKGTISCIFHVDTWYCFATYLGAKVLLQSKDLWIVKQGRYVLVVKSYPEGGNSLASPYNGKMCGKIKEQLDAKVEYRLFENSKEIFCIRSRRASVESVEERM